MRRKNEGRNENEKKSRDRKRIWGSIPSEKVFYLHHSYPLWDPHNSLFLPKLISGCDKVKEYLELYRHSPVFLIRGHT
jgi:hypothetical protein